MIDWNRVIDTTPGLIRSVVILLLLGVIVLLGVTIAGAVWNGQKIQAWGLLVEEYHSPDAQKCASVAATIQHVNTINENALSLLNSQITSNLNLADKYTQEAADINNRGQLSVVGEKFRDQTVLLQKEIADLRKKQNEIIDTRNQIAETLQVACEPKHK